MSCVYQARNRVNGKRYIGKTVGEMEDRRGKHERNAREGNGFAFQHALRKYGFDAFEWKVLMECEDEEDLNQSERFCIKTLRTKVPGGYNLTDGGEGTSGYEVSAETRAKISKSVMGRPAWNLGIPNPSICGRLAVWNKGKPAWNRGKITPPEVRAKQRTSAKKRCATEEGKEQMRRAGRKSAEVNKHLLGRLHTPEAVEKNRLAHLGKKHSPEQVAKNRAVAMKRSRDSLGRFLPCIGESKGVKSGA